MKKKLLVFCASIMLLIPGCKKNNNTSTPVSAQITAIKQTISNGNNYNLLETFIYDDEEKQLKEIKQYLSNGSVISKRYTYAENEVQYRSYLDGTEQPFESVSYSLNTAGLVHERTSAYYGFSSVYTYNDRDFLTNAAHYHNGILEGFEVYHYGTNSRLDSMVYFDRDSIVTYVNLYTWSADKKNTTGNRNKGLRIFGKDHEQVIKKETRMAYNLPNREGNRLKYFELEYEYSYDNEERIKTATITRTDYRYPGGNSSIYVLAAYEYSYQ